MRNRLTHWLNNTPLTNPVARRQASIFQVVLLIWIALTSLGIPTLLLAPRDQAPALVTPAAQLSLVLLSIAGMLLWLVPIVSLVLLRRGQLTAAVGIAGFGILAAHSLASFVLGFRDPSILVVFQLPIALLGLLAGRRTLWAATSLSIAVVVVVGVLQSLTPPLAGTFMPSGVEPNNLGVPIAQPVGFFVVITILVAVLLDRFGSALRDALNSALEREQELVGIRASLEKEVAVRTAELRAALSDVQTQAAEQQRLLAEVAQQRATIQDLSVPVIPISASTLVMPLVGALDSTRLRQAQEQSLQALERSSARALVLDITGVPIVDTQVAQGLLTMVRSARLLGADVALVGIRPEVAQTMVGLGIDLRDVHTFSDLQSALDR
jgi:rsbT co-antagonist protein RsbR